MRQTVNKSGYRIGAIVAAAALLLSGCSGLLGTDIDEPQQPVPSAPAPAATTSSASTAAGQPATPSPGATASGAPNGVPSDLGDPAATRNTTADQEKITIAAYPIRRSDTLAVMYFTVAVDPSARKSVDIWDLFGDGDSTIGDDNSFNSVDGVRLVDNTRRKVYLVASDGRGICLCSRDLDRDLKPGETYTFHATYAAPPAEVTALDVAFPKSGTLSRVPVQ